MLSFSPEKLFIVGLIALVVLGPNRLPEAARTLGRFVATARRLSSGVQTELRDALAEPREAFDAALGSDFRPPDVRRSVRAAINSTLSPPARAASERPEEAPLASAAHSQGLPEGSEQLRHPDEPSNN